MGTVWTVRDTWTELCVLVAREHDVENRNVLRLLAEISLDTDSLPTGRHELNGCECWYKSNSVRGLFFCVSSQMT